MEELRVESGTITAVIGPNGCGKTTLFKLLNGLLTPAAGVIRMEGLDAATAAGRHAIRYRSFYVHQKPYIFRERVRDNVAYGLKVRKVPREQWDERIAASLQAVGLADLAHRHGPALSGGERQRLALARALALRPDLLLLDEPTSNIDPDSVRYIETAITRARDAGMTILLSTHNLATAYRIADVVVPMEAGSLRRDRNNVYHGRLVTGDTDGPGKEAGSRNADDPLARFTFHQGAIVTPALDGSFTAAVVPMDDVILSRGAVASSAQNAFSGTVVELEPFDGLVRVGVDCGFPLSALVTQNAVDQLHLSPGAPIHASFKASAVRLY